MVRTSLAVHAEVFGEIRPAATLAEIEADAYSPTDPPAGEKDPSGAGR